MRINKSAIITGAVLLLLGLSGAILGDFAFTHRFVIRHSRLPTAAQYFGTDGYEVIGDFANYPAYATVTASRVTPFVWQASTTDVRALQKATDPTNIDRIAACWFGDSYFDIDINITDGNQHQVALYFLDWDHAGRVQEIDIYDSSNGHLLDQRSIASFDGGVYALYNVSGHVYFRIRQIAGPNAVISGIFFQPVGIPPSPTSTPTPTPAPTATPSPSVTQTPTPVPTPTPSPTPTPTSTPLPFCLPGTRPGNPPQCICQNGFAGNSGKCR